MYILLILLKCVVIVICLELIIGCIETTINRVKVYCNTDSSNSTLMDTLLCVLIDLLLICMGVFIILLIFGIIPLNFIPN